ncbi:MAG: hypothetical protein PHT69_12610 [Bacteroidales bacterium]|nr:hypothetical protein [Bacteroidales bacterium]
MLKISSKKLLIAFIIIFAFIALFPLLFKNSFLKEFNRQMQLLENVTAQYSHVDLYWGRSFPDFTLRVDDLSLTGTDLFSGQNLAEIGRVKLTVDFWSLVFGQQIKVKSVKLNNADIHLIKQENQFNFIDIKKAKKEGDNFELSLDRFIIINSNISYQDFDDDFEISALNLNQWIKRVKGLEGNNYSMTSRADSFTVSSHNIDLLQHVAFQCKMLFHFDPSLHHYIIEPTKVNFNDLTLNVEGEFGFEGEQTFLNMNGSSNGDIKQLFSVVNVFYGPDYNKIISDGTYSINAFLELTSDDIYNEKYDFSLKAQDGSLKYDFLPDGFSEINIDVALKKNAEENKYFVADISLKTKADSLCLKLYQSDEEEKTIYKNEIDVVMDFSTLNSIIPDTKLEKMGRLIIDLNFNGTFSKILPDLNELNSEGYIAVGGLNYQKSFDSRPVFVDTAYLAFSDNSFAINKLSTRFGKTNLEAEGNWQNFINYVLFDEVLRGEWHLKAPCLNLNDIMASEIQETHNSDTLITGFSNFFVPRNIALKLWFDADTLIVNNTLVGSAHSVIDFENETMTVHALNVTFKEGKGLLRGLYRNTMDEGVSSYFTNDFENVDIQDFAQIFPVLKNIWPQIINAKGKINTTIDISYNKGFSTYMKNSDLLSAPSIFYNELIKQDDSDMHWFLKSRIPALEIRDIPFFEEIADKLQLEILEKGIFNNAMIEVFFVQGKSYVKNLSFSIDDIVFNATGSWNVEHRLQLDFKIEIPPKYFTGKALENLNSLASENNINPDTLLSEAAVIFCVSLKENEENTVIDIDL